MLKEIQMVGCQSWKDGTIELSSGLNVIIGENETGKSVLYKMLKVTSSPKYFKQDKIRKLIRWGEDSANIIFTFDDGSVGITKVTNKNVIYGYRESEGDSFRVSYYPIPEVIQKLGLITNKDGSFICNLIDMDQDLLLVKSDLKDNDCLMQSLVYNEELALLEERLNQQKSKFSDYAIRANRFKSIISRQLEGLEYMDLAKSERELNLLDTLSLSLDKLLRVDNKLTTMPRVQCDLNYDNAIEEANSLEILESVQDALNSIAVSAFNCDSLAVLGVLESLEGIQAAFDSVAIDTFHSDDLKILGALESIEGVNALLDSLSVSEFNNKSIVGIQSLEHLEEIEDNFKIIRESIETVDSLKLEISSLHEEFLNNGTIYECPIYGEVLFDGKECIPSRD